MTKIDTGEHVLISTNVAKAAADFFGRRAVIDGISRSELLRRVLESYAQANGARL